MKFEPLKNKIYDIDVAPRYSDDNRVIHYRHIKSAVEWLKQEYRLMGGDAIVSFNILVDQAFEDVREK